MSEFKRLLNNEPELLKELVTLGKMLRKTTLADLRSFNVAISPMYRLDDGRTEYPEDIIEWGDSEIGKYTLRDLTIRLLSRATNIQEKKIIVLLSRGCTKTEITKILGVNRHRLNRIISRYRKKFNK